jgi:hypothetical protein
MAMAIFGARKCIQQQLGFRYTLSYILLLIVAVGSFFFHLTLLWLVVAWSPSGSDPSPPGVGNWLTNYPCWRL